ncbi:MAG: ABC transporter ATP-binding protein [Egibacteraceae bacterium]
MQQVAGHTGHSVLQPHLEERAARKVCCQKPEPWRSALRVESLTVVHGRRGRTVAAVRDVSFSVAPGECVALIGSSGSGKTTIARCVVGLQRPASGAVLLDGQPLAGGAAARTGAQRRRVQMVFQNPAESLNPRHTASASIARAARLLRGLSPAGARGEAARLLEQVRLSGAVGQRYPWELSGGERQRVAIARALAGRPDVLVCDEITSSLDVSVQAAILELLDDLRRRLGLSLLFISHDLKVVASVADRVVVLADGAVAEQGPIAEVLGRPTHPHTRRLVAAAFPTEESPWRERMQT